MNFRGWHKAPRLGATVGAAALIAMTAFSVESVTAGDWQLTIRTNKTEYAPGEPIDAYRELMYRGPSDRMTIGTAMDRPIGFGIRQLDGSAALETSFPAICDSWDFVRGEPHRQPLHLRGGWTVNDPNDALYRSLENEPLQLPRGRWELIATVDGGPDGGSNCQGEFKLRASTRLTVS